MAVRIPGFKTGDSSLPLAQLVAEDLAINRRASLLARLKGRSGHIFSKSGTNYWKDYRTGVEYAITGEISSAANSDFNDKQVATLASGAYVDLGEIMPVNADYTQIVVYKRNANSSTMVLLGDDELVNWNSLHLMGTNGRVNVVHNGAAYSDDTDVAMADVHVLAATWDQSETALKIFVDGVEIASTTLASGKTAAQLYIGFLGFTSVPYAGQIAEVMLFNEHLSGTDLTDITDYMMSDYGIV